MRIALRVGVLVTALLVSFPTVASAHPLGNFTINHYAGLELRPDGLSIDYVLDFAEIPTFQLRGAIAPDPATACASIAQKLAAALDSLPLAIRVDAGRASFASGQAGLDTLRLECSLRAPWSLDRAPHQLAFSDATYAERIGWREITARADGVAIETGLPSFSASARLTAYPQDAYTSSADARTAEVRFSLGAATAQAPAPAPVALVPGSDLLSSVLGRDLGSLPILLALAVAVALGALHAVTPGHGKTIMAAYLVGTRRSLRDAAALGLIIAAAHTVGVLGLALVVLGGATLLPAERVYPILSALSALVVVGLGLTMLRRELAHRAEHHHAHRHEHNARAGTASLVALGLAGGLVPSASALVLLLGAVGAHRAELGVLLTVAFGLGMAATLIGAGAALVATRRVIERVALAPRLFTLAPLVAALAVLAVGIGLTAQSVAALL
jgi:ABC-type nickel/cobalt efflux system permease component RcnA